MGGGESTWLGIYGYTQEGVISNVDWFNRAKERNLYFANGWHIFTQFSHLQATNLRYLEGVIWEDVLFAELLFAQSERIAILPEMLVHYRVRQNNTTNFGGVKQKNLPPFVKPLEKYFSDSNEAWAYFSAYSWCVSAVEFMRFCETYSDKIICAQLKAIFFKMMLLEASRVMDFQCDPYNIKIEFLALARQEKHYLPLHKRQFAYYDTPVLWEVYNIYPFFRSVAKRLRDFMRQILKIRRI